MLDKQKKHKNTMNNINININLKVESKNNQLVGKKISNHKELNQKHQQMMRSNISTETLNRKKFSGKQQSKYKKSVEEFVNEHTVSYQNNHSDEDAPMKQIQPKPTQARNNYLKQNNKNEKKRLKSKSLQHLKIHFYQRSLEKSRESKSKSKEKQREHKKNDSPKSFVRSGKQMKSPPKQKSKSKSKSKSRSKSKQKSKSPITISKKKSLQIFKVQQNSSRQRSKQRSKEKTPIMKKPQNTGRQKSKTQSTNINKKYSDQIKRQMATKKTSNPKKQRPKKPQKPQKGKSIFQGVTKQVKKGAKVKKQKFIYHQLFLNKMATKIQSFWRGYILRKKLKQQLKEISNGIQNKRSNINHNDDNESDLSIICIDNQSNNSVRSKKSLNKNSGRNMKQQSKEALNPMILQEIQKLRRKIQQQQNRFKILQQQNIELKANLHKINKQPIEIIPKLSQESQKYRPLQLKIQNQDNLSNEFPKSRLFDRRKREHIYQLPVLIKTEESNSSYDYSDMKKKMEIYECSPKNSNQQMKFNKNIIKKLFVKEQQKLNQKYFKKNKQYQDMLQNQLVSPKTYNVHCEQLQSRFKQQKQQAINKFKQAQKALLLVAQLQEQNNVSESNLQVDKPRKQNLHSNNNSANSSKQSSPSKKAINFHVNVDQIDSDAQKYHPILVNHPQRQYQFEAIKEEQDLSLLYKKAMNQKIEVKKSDEYITQQNQQESSAFAFQRQYNSPEIQVPQSNQQNSILRQGKKGFQTSISYMRIFYIKLCQFFRKIPEYKSQIIDNLSEEMIFDLEIFLKTYRVRAELSQDRQLVFPYFKQLATYNIALPVHILHSFYEEQTNPQSTLFNKACAQLKQTSQDELQTYNFSYFVLKQYHDLALIDAFNESLNFQRPGGIEASNLDILTQDFHTINVNKIKRKFQVDIDEQVKQESLDVILGSSIGRVINNWAFNLCGFLNDSEDQDEHVDEQKLEEIRQARLNLMLQKVLVEEEPNYTNMSYFKFSVRYDLQIKILNHILQQFMKQLRLLILLRERRN